MNHQRFRIILMLLGNLLLGLSVGVYIVVDLGTDPYTAMNIGISSTLGLSFGFYQLLFNLLLFIVILVYDRSLIGFGTFVNMTMIGFIADFVVYIFGLLDLESLSILIRVLLLFGSVPIACIGLSLYTSTKLGVAPYDALPLLLMKLTGERLPFSLARVVVDVTAVIIGFSFGAVIGVGTVMIMLIYGPLIHYFNRHVSEPLIQKQVALTSAVLIGTD